MAKIGIDLGTTNSVVAYWAEDCPRIIPNVFGSNLTPSVVSVDESTNEILVGQVAKERLITHPHVTAAVFKRFMGTQKLYKLGKYSFSPEELSSFVIRTLKADAEAYLGHDVEEAIISVPAYFNDMQRTATKRSAELAGLKVERLITEPTAAALSYGLHQRDSESKFMVFDLGGGTFDVSVLELFEGIMEVKSIAGDNYLGGEDFSELLITTFAERLNLDLNALDEKERAALYKQAELCKKSLSDKATGEMSFVHEGEMQSHSFSRDEYERLANQLLLRLRRPVERALRDASVSPKELEAVILIGGATRMPVVRSIVGRMFSSLPYTNINPDEAVALGAAVQVALKERDASLEELILTDVCPYTLGTGVARQIGKDKHESGFYLPIIERNTPIPVSRVQRLQTVQDNQTTILVDVYQGESHKVDGNVKLGEMKFKIPPAKAGVETFDVRFTYDINGILEVETTTVSTGARNRVVLENSSCGLTKSEIDARFEALNDIKIHPRDKMEHRLLMARGERLYEESLGEKREYVAYLLQRFESVLEQQNEHDIRHISAEIKEKFEEIEGWFEFE